MNNRLTRYRERRGLTTAELADELGVSEQTIKAIEKEKYDPSLPLAKAIARYFRVAVEDVFPASVDEATLTTATFLMTDIEGSTVLATELEQRYVGILARQRELLSEVFVDHGGRVVDDTGDACFAAFERPDQAVAAARAAQLAVANEPWPAGCRVQVRMGIHRGEAFAVGNRFVGLAVHETARVCGAASGGQILISDRASAALGDSSTLTDIGKHQLAGLHEPMQMFEVHPAGDSQ